MSNAYRDKLLGIGVISGRPAPREYRDGTVRVKQVTDEAGNVLTWRGDHPDGAPGVEIRPKTITLADGRVATHREA